MLPASPTGYIPANPESSLHTRCCDSPIVAPKRPHSSPFDLIDVRASKLLTNMRAFLESECVASSCIVNITKKKNMLDFLSQKHFGDLSVHV